jgi:F0F1-type ATP synthase membrane subunit c/vacuolar-type H+-ATPase subunit K
MLFRALLRTSTPLLRRGTAVGAALGCGLALASAAAPSAQAQSSIPEMLVRQQRSH